MLHAALHVFKPMTETIPNECPTRISWLELELYLGELVNTEALQQTTLCQPGESGLLQNVSLPST